MYSSREKINKLYDAIYQIQEFYNDYAKGLNISYHEIKIYCALLDDEIVTQTLLCEYTGCSKTTINSMIKRFLQRGHIVMLENPENRREKFLVMTEAGIDFATEHIVPLMELEEKAADFMSDNEVNVGYYVYQKYLDQLKAGLPQPPVLEE